MGSLRSLPRNQIIHISITTPKSRFASGELTSACKRSDSSGWYERALRERGRCLSTSKAIADVLVVVVCMYLRTPVLAWAIVKVSDAFRARV